MLTSDVVPTALGAYQGHTASTYQTSLVALTGYNIVHDCTAAVTPYAGEVYVQGGNGTWDRPCRSYGFPIAMSGGGAARQGAPPTPTLAEVRPRTRSSSSTATGAP